jgi:hypothetical protein
MATIKLGDLLVRANLLGESQLRSALAEQKKWGGRLGAILVRMELVSEKVLVEALSRQMRIPAANLEAVPAISLPLRQKVPFELARQLWAVPLELSDDGRNLVVAMSEPQNLHHTDLLRARTGCRIIAQLAGQTAIQRALSRLYDVGPELSPVPENSFKVVKRIVDHRLRAPHQAPAPAGGNPVELLRAVEEVQRKEITALNAMVELLIERGVFSRDEYLAKVRR